MELNHRLEHPSLEIALHVYVTDRTLKYMHMCYQFSGHVVRIFLFLADLRSLQGQVATTLTETG